MLVAKQNIALCLFGQLHIGSLYLADIEMLATPSPIQKQVTFPTTIHVMLAPTGADRRTLLLVAAVLRGACCRVRGSSKSIVYSV